MKALIIGASGTIGKAITDELRSDTVLLTANNSSGDFKLDLADNNSIKDLFQNTGPLDAILCAAARGVVFKSVAEMSIVDYINSLQQKLLGQISVALEGLKVLNDRGSITLTTGVMNRDFVAKGSAASMVNSAVEGFVRAAACELPRGLRINVVSPALLEESVEQYGELFPGFETVSARKVARAYRKSVYGIQNGQIICVC